jgi:hypothetical protein
MVEIRYFDHRQTVMQKPLKSPDLANVSPFLWKKNINFCFRDIPLWFFILSQINPVLKHPASCFKFHFAIKRSPHE